MDKNPQASGEPKKVKLELYKSKEKIHPREVRGRFQTLRALAVWVLLGLFYVLPWLNWNGHQAVLFDLPHRRFYIFGLTFWPQDFIYLSWLLIIAAFSLFFFTALAGRLWCGYACPQTVWTELFIWIERWVEGDRNKQIKLDKSPWTRQKIIKKALKHTLWIALALWTGYTFVGYFTPIRELGHNLLHGQLGPWETFWILFYALATYGNAGILREQVCLYMCPYARFQSAMFDRDTLIISYDEKRGEPRMKGRKRREEALARGEPVGDCIDCTMCVQVCPTGIDIRDGLQYECIACAACIDACDEVMIREGKEPGLIRYTTENALEGKPTHILRPRMVFYFVVLMGMVGLFVYSLTHRQSVQVDVLRDRNALYRIVDSHTVENVYTLKVANKGDKPLHFQVSAEGIPGIHVLIPDQDKNKEAAPGELINLTAKVRAPMDKLKRIQTIRLTVQGIEDPQAKDTEKTKYFGPRKR